MKKAAASTAFDLMQIAVMAPWVVALRLARFSSPLPQHLQRNTREALSMTHEKTATFIETWSKASTSIVRSNLALVGAMSIPWTPTNAAANVRRIQRSTERSAAGLAAAVTTPVRRRVVANAKRLTRQKG